MLIFNKNIILLKNIFSTVCHHIKLENLFFKHQICKHILFYIRTFTTNMRREKKNLQFTVPNIESIPKYSLIIL